VHARAFKRGLRHDQPLNRPKRHMNLSFRVSLSRKSRTLSDGRARALESSCANCEAAKYRVHHD
jgi:hypothetical protein